MSLDQQSRSGTFFKITRASFICHLKNSDSFKVQRVLDCFPSVEKTTEQSRNHKKKKYLTFVFYVIDFDYIVRAIKVTVILDYIILVVFTEKKSF